jgi:LysR family carnitine catabolism transcriptional activator
MEFTSRQLRGFLLVAQHRNFSRAAERLFITPSGLSVLIRELEAQLGFRLFDRTTRQVTLTSRGRELHGVVQRNLDQLDAAMSGIGRSASEDARTLSIGATPLVAANVLPEAIMEFRAHRPQLRIQVFDEFHAGIMQRVESGELDMGLGVVFQPAPAIRRTPLFRFSLMVIRPHQEPGVQPLSMKWSGLKGEELIALNPTLLLQQFIDKHLKRAGITQRPRLTVNFLDTQIAMVEAGEGVAVIPSYVVRACRNRRVAMTRLLDPVVNLDFYEIRNRGRRLPAGAEEFTSFLQSYIARWAGRAGVL